MIDVDGGKAEPWEECTYVVNDYPDGNIRYYIGKGIPTGGQPTSAIWEVDYRCKKATFRGFGSSKVGPFITMVHEYIDRANKAIAGGSYV